MATIKDLLSNMIAKIHTKMDNPIEAKPYQQLVTDSNGAVRLEDRTHYKDSFLVLKTDPNTDPTDGNRWDGGANSIDSNLAEASYVMANEMGYGYYEGRYTHFIFYIDGVRYELPAKIPFMLDPDKGHPFTLLVMQYGAMVNGTGFRMLIEYYDGKEHTIQFELDTPKIKSLSPEYITGTELTEADNGKVLGVADGAIALIDADTQSNWDETDENNKAFIKNKPDENDAFELITEFNLISPVTDADGAILTDENGIILDM